MRIFHAFLLTVILLGTVLSLVGSAVSATVFSLPLSLVWSDIRNLSNSDHLSEGVVIAAFFDTVHVVWVETVDGRPEIYHTFQVGEGDWSTPARIEAGTQPDLAVGPDGSFDLVWVNESGEFIRYRRWDSALQDWVDATNVAVGSRGTLQSPAVAVGPAGVSHVVWVDLVTGSPRLRHRRRSTSGWDTPENVRHADGGVTPDISVDADGEVHMVWARRSLFGDTQDIYYLWKDPIAGWSEAGFPRVLSDRQLVNSADPTISIDSNDILYVCWQESSGSSSAILHRSGRESNWFLGTQEVVRQVGRVEAPAIAIDGSRFVHLAFAGPDGVDYQVRALTGQRWQAGESIVVHEPAAASPGLAAVEAGTVHAVWIAPGVGGQTDVFYRTAGPGLGPAQTTTPAPTFVATTTLTVTLTPTSTSTAMPTSTSTPGETATPSTTPTPTATETPSPTQMPSPTPSPTTTQTPSPTPTEAPFHKTYLSLVMRNLAGSKGRRMIHPSLLEGGAMDLVQPMPP